MAKKRYVQNRGRQQKGKRAVVLFVCTGIFLVAALIFLAVIQGPAAEKKEQDTGITEKILSFSGYTRVVEPEEVAFFQTLAHKEVRDNSDEEAVNERAEALLEMASAQFYLGNKLGVSKPYSFQYMRESMAQENAQRKVDKEQGEPVYGPVEYTLDSYYQYVSGNLRIKIMDYIVSHADQPLVEQAEAYYKKHKDDYQTPERVRYSITADGETREEELEWDEVEELEHTDYNLFDVLIQAEEGLEASYETEYGETAVKVLAVTRQKSSFEEQKTAVITDYLDQEYYDKLLEQVAEKNPIQFTND